MSLIIGEFIGTYLMLTLGFGISELINYFLYPRLQTRYITGLYWGLSIYFASLVTGLLFGTANYNPVFSIVQTLNGQISIWIMLGEIIAQIIAAWLAAQTTWSIWERWLYTLPVNLNFYATVPSNVNHRLRNFLWEAGGTAVIAINSQTISLWGFNSFFNITISSFITACCITVISPITGAAFNPTRDWVPRAFFSHKFNAALSQWRYAWIPMLGPLAGAAVIMLIKGIIVLIFNQK
ncbi:aquaporin [Nicoliella spurrieriana]|uniref:Aquaporin n=1 Tax=Nicoliella spurrieriana TaxID=2925830 RepID=A0A976RRG8_9LACO|nr:aquaporin [Nicoliella spurrieriana]UQS86271.1 aquaporin [Nicoliella spurrieriana]